MHTARFGGALLAALLILPAPVAAHAKWPVEVMSATALTPVVDTAGGFANLEIEVHLRDSDGLPDELGEPAVVGVGGTAVLPGELTFLYLHRVSGSATDGIWRGSLRVSPAWEGTFEINQIYSAAVPDGPTFTVRGDRWVVTPLRETVRVVTGGEYWYPRARLTHVDGRPIAGARIRAGSITVGEPSPPLDASSDANGLWTAALPQAPVNRVFLGAAGARGSRGFSLQGATCSDVTVKLQASSTYPAGPVTGGNPVLVTGNVWPAPQVMRAGGNLQLQRQTATGWETVGSVAPRGTGRYTLTWYEPPVGTHTLRVRWPGAGTPAECQAHSVGTTLATATVQVR